jgi:hypothetical protein
VGGDEVKDGGIEREGLRASVTLVNADEHPYEEGFEGE